MANLKDQVDEINEALKERSGWEQELARGQAQRKCMDRAKINNNPWPRASNVRYPLSDTLISQFTPFLFKILYASERVAYFRAMSAANASLGGVCADWFDYKIKNETDLEEEIQPTTDQLLQDGETVLKIMWDSKRQTFDFESVDNLFFITPSTALVPLDRYAPWCVHVLQKSPKWVKNHFKDVEGIDGFLDRVKDGTCVKNDQGQREEAEYLREGINISSKNKNIVLWEKHYRTVDESGNAVFRIVTLSPDEPSFDFKDDREYEHDIGGFMFEHTRWEKLDRKPHSARGIPRLVMEGEFTLTALERAKQNSMTLYNTPVWWSTGTTPGSTQNITWQPGAGLPFPIEIAKFGEPPISWDVEAQNQRSKWERRVGSPDYGLGKSNTMNDSRTATEVKAIGFQNSQAVDLITGNWRMFLGKCFQKAWRYVVSVKPKQLEVFVNGKNVVLPPEALNDKWQISISGSAESVNKETMTQKAIALWQMCANNPFANIAEAWKNVLQNLTPGEVDRFFQDPAARQQMQAKKTQSDIGTMIATGSQMLPDPTDDLLVAGSTALQYLSRELQRTVNPQVAQQMQGTPQLSGQTSNLISQYIAACREGLKKTNPAAYQQFNEMLNQFDLQSQQQAQQQQAMANQTSGGENVAQINTQPEQLSPPASVIPLGKKKINKSITLLRDPSGRLVGARVNGIETDEGGGEPQIERKQIDFVANPDGKLVGATINGMEEA